VSLVVRRQEGSACIERQTGSSLKSETAKSERNALNLKLREEKVPE
jgi:hypothetical protein